MPEDHMTTALAIPLVPEAFEHADSVSSRYGRELAQTATSTNSSWIDGGIGSSRSLRLSR